MKDVNFLAHEPLLDKFRALRSYERKIKKAKAKKAYHAVDRLEERKPQYGLDHLVKERYPSFGDALRDFDDPLTLTHLFALLPADKRHGIPVELVTRARALALEFQVRIAFPKSRHTVCPYQTDTFRLQKKAFITKTNALRKVFISVKGIYYQATVHGQEITWYGPFPFNTHRLPDYCSVWSTVRKYGPHSVGPLSDPSYTSRPTDPFGFYPSRLTPHALAQTLPEDVDYRVMLTFLEFYLAMMGFVNYKLYHDNQLRYPPVLDTKLEDNAAGIVAVIHNIADSIASRNKAKPVVTAAKKGAKQATDTEARMKTLDFSLIKGGDEDEEVVAVAAGKGAVGGDGSDDARGDGDADAEMEDAIAEAGGADPAQREDAKMCATLFKGLVFFLNREVPREMMVFIIRSFGGEVSWDGEGSPYDEKDGGVTHHVCDRPIQKSDMKPQREYVQPQWVVDCANWRVLIPCVEYAPGVAPPPHLSPFVDAEDEGYTPDYQQTLMRLKAQAKAAREGRSLADVETQIVRLRTDAEEAADEEKQYAKDLSKDTSGIPYSRSLAQGEEGSSDEESDDEEDVEVEDEESDDDDDDEESDSDADDADAAAGIKKRKASKLTVEMAMRDKDITINKRMKEMGEDEEMDAMRHVLLPRKKRELYRAMQLGLAKKEQRADTLKDRKEKLKAEGKYRDDKAAGDEAKAKPAAPAKKDAAKKKPVAKKK